MTAKRSGRRRGPFTDSRRADTRLLGRGIQSCWKLYTRGSVGGQMLVGLPAIHRLLTHRRVGARCRVWPFETRWDARLDGIVLAEIWPSLFNFRTVAHPIKDAQQVIAACVWARRAQAGGFLRRAFARPGDLDPAEAASLVQVQPGQRCVAYFGDRDQSDRSIVITPTGLIMTGAKRRGPADGLGVELVLLSS